jgi:hypothetical protein
VANLTYEEKMKNVGRTSFQHSNYIKKNERSQMFFEKKYFFFKFSADKFPKKIRAFKSKGKFKSKKRINRTEAFKNYAFIEYNQQVCNFIIVDIDHRKLKISDIIEILSEREIPPTMIIKTNRGYQVFWELSHPFVTNEKYQNEIDKQMFSYAKFIQRKLTFILKGDMAALRIKGIWRNPVFHKYYYYPKRKYELNELDVYVKHMDEKNVKPDETYLHLKDSNEIKAKVAEVLINGTAENVYPGMRNNVLWMTGMFIAKEEIKEAKTHRRKMLLFRKVKDELYRLNATMPEPLSRNEVKGIAKSIYRYIMDESVFVTFGRYADWPKEVKAAYMRRYRASRTLKKKNEAIWTKNIEKPKLSPIAILTKMDYWLNKLKTKSEVIRVMNISRKTFYKYYKILQNKKTLLNLAKLLVCLREGNTYSDTKKSFEIFEKISLFFYAFFRFERVEFEKFVVLMQEGGYKKRITSNFKYK